MTDKDFTELAGFASSRHVLLSAWRPRRPGKAPRAWITTTSMCRGVVRAVKGRRASTADRPPMSCTARWTITETTRLTYVACLQSHEGKTCYQRDEIRELIAQGVIISARMTPSSPQASTSHISQHPPKVQAGCWTGYQSTTDLTPLELDAPCEMEELSWRDQTHHHAARRRMAEWRLKSACAALMTCAHRSTAALVSGASSWLCTSQLGTSTPVFGQITLELVNHGHRPASCARRAHRRSSSSHDTCPLHHTPAGTPVRWDQQPRGQRPMIA